MFFLDCSSDACKRLDIQKATDMIGETPILVLVFKVIPSARINSPIT